MGLGTVGLQTSQKKEQSGAPFASGAAANGLSVDGTTGQIVLGNDSGSVTAPAQLTSLREIDTNKLGTGPFAFSLIDSTNSSGTAMNGSVVSLFETAGLVQPTLNIFSGTAGGAFVIQQGLVKFKALSNATDVVISSSFSNIGVMRFQQVSPYGVHFHAAGSNAYNNATVQVSGTITFRRLSVSTGVNVSIDRDLDTGKLWRNSAAANLTLPNMSGSNARPGFILRAWCNNAAGLTITASSGQVIRFGSLVTSSAGTLTTTDVGACVTIVNIDSGTWMTESFCGAWSLT